ncbi:hypothetical protein PENANT_c025G04408 [Penicillium antarcticum]|uniref:Methyltransferase domain-containing protein n=1 Tax=Penicillium antarcticum TaxID=416450 RepID=A0A1V6PXL1_9EURO|nr:uncharacterized protein N7508_000309 [Penicillium antarcticum]KAJ5320026.1 hypothetical protein N7508_000309 [Penicillium antarcticum]OQD81711.1 hypothetical protein PENANT_c025G04408 [Penicillium antarcticum]
MSPKVDTETLFKSEAFAVQYKFAETMTGPFGQSLIDQTKLVEDATAKPDQPLVVLDNACGTGIISSLLNEQLDSSIKQNWKLTCGDISTPLLEYTARRMKEEGWQNAETKVVNAQETGLPSDHFTHVFSAFVLMAIPKPFNALDETVRIVQPGGTIAFSTWIEPGWFSIARKAIATIPGNMPFPTTQEFLKMTGDGEWNSAPWIKSQLKDRGLEDINVQEESRNIAVLSSRFTDITMMMLNMIIQSFWTEKQREENGDKVRRAMEKYVLDTYGENEDIDTKWTAIISTARKPQ